MKNKTILAALLMCCTFPLIAQTAVDKSIKNAQGKHIQLNFNYADVAISTWDKNEIEIKGKVTINDGQQDEYFTIDVKEQGDEINIETFVKDLDQLPEVVMIIQNGEKTFKKKTSGSSSLSNYHGYRNVNIWTDHYPIDINLEIKLPRNSKLTIESLYGNVALNNVQNELDVETTHGRLKAIFNKPSLSQPIKLLSTHNVVDVSMQASAKLDLLLQSEFGKIYSDIKIERPLRGDGMRSLSPKLIEGTLNGGGTLVNLESTHNTIYLREIKS